VAKTMAKMPDERGIGNVGSVTATATARQAETEGAENAHVSALMSMIHGYAVVKSWNMAGARKTATMVPMPCANHCWFGGVRRRNPVRKSLVRSDDWFAPMLAMAPPSRLSFCAWVTFQCSPLVAPPRTIWEALEAAVKGVMSVIVGTYDL